MSTEEYVKFQLSKIEVGKTIHKESIKVFGIDSKTHTIPLDKESAQVIVRWLQDNFINNKPKGK